MLRSATTLGLLAVSLAATAGVPGAAGGEHVGAGSCGSANCHGAAASRGGRILQNEFVTWQRQDAHANAYRLLQSAQGKRIAANLGIGAPTEAPQCLACHSDAVAPERRGRQWRAADGVTCETCHGGAGGWLKTHYEVSRGGVAAREGMVPLDPPLSRARLCLHCHSGSVERPITHRLMSAGHPRLSFELDTFTAIEPAHFVVDGDYRQRKKAPSGAATWIAGQLVAAEFLLDGLRSPRFTHELFPELVFYDCYSCHQPLPASGASLGPGLATGKPRLNRTPLLMTGPILAVLAPALAADWQAAVKALEDAAQDSPQQLRDGAARLAALLKDIQGRLDGRDLPAGEVRALAEAVANLGAERAAELAVAEQVAMAIGTLATHLAPFQPDKGASMEPPVKALFAAVAKPAGYEPGRFQAAIGQFKKTATK